MQKIETVLPFTRIFSIMLHYMGIEGSQSDSKMKGVLSTRRWLSILRLIAKCGRRLYDLLAPRAYSVIIFAALFCTLAAKFFYSWDNGLVKEYSGWVLSDISFLLMIEVVLALVCFRWPKKFVIRMAIVVAAIICTWSVLNAGWLIRTGNQILPGVLLTLFRDPLNALRMVGVNLIKMPVAAVILLAPSSVALAFFFMVIAKPRFMDYNRQLFAKRIVVCVVIVALAVLLRGPVVRYGSGQVASMGLRYNCQLRAVLSFLLPGSGRFPRADFINAKRKIPYFDEIQLELLPKSHRIKPVRSNPGTSGDPSSVQTSNGVNHNVVLVVLEGVQYNYTTLADSQTNLTPYLATLAGQGVEFAKARSSMTHTTKALFAFLTGRYPSVCQDLSEAVPAVKPYTSIATILKSQLNFRTAFFQSAKGSFETRPGLVHNLGYDKFWARDDLNDPNSFIGYLGCDEFAMLEPIAEWIKADEKPFFLTVLCSVTHDPYEVPAWYGESAKELVERYRQAVSYTDKFLAALDAELTKLNLADKTIFCVVGDHGEALGEHGKLGHAGITFDEVLHIPWVVRAPFLLEPGTKVTEAVSSIDLAPTLLALLGFDISGAEFDGVDALTDIPDDRKVYFSSWIQPGPAGFIKGNRKFIYNSVIKMVSVYDLGADPLELFRIELPEEEAQKITDEITAWRKESIFRIDQPRRGKKMLFDSWLCRWTSRVPRPAKYQPKAKS